VLRHEASPSSLEDQLRGLLERQRAAVLEHRYPSASERRRTLRTLLEMVVDHQADIVEAEHADFRASAEAVSLDMLPTTLAIRHAIRHVRRWMRPEKRRLSPIWGVFTARVHHHPMGVVGIISPWNYPMLLAVGPLVGALAAGNRAMVKLSEHSPHFSELFARLVAERFPPEQLAVVTGGPEVASAFSRLPFDHLVFTGSTDIGRLVARAAAENLVPTTLELGGKSPTIVEPGFPLDQLGSLVFGKLMNSGQSCTAPDHVFVHESDRDAFVERFEATVKRHYPSWADPRDVACIVNERHVARLREYVEDARARGATVREINPGGDDAAALGRRVLPTLVLDPPDDAKIMQEEIFGPLLPVRSYRDVAEVIAHLNARPHPLALYVYGRETRFIERVRLATQSGALCVNFTGIHFGIDEVPAGGVGFSGTGAYHGVDGFLRFSHRRLYMRPLWNATQLLFPPYGGLFRRAMRLLVRK
jgi:coniferyl-aldehyde dehydrogenase